MIIDKYKDQASLKDLCQWVGMARSSYYYKPSTGKRGRKPSTCTQTIQGTWVSNQEVVGRIKDVLSDEFLGAYGYEKTCWELHDQGYIINKKKVYRLMDEHHLLLKNQRIQTQGKRKFVSKRKIHAERPMQYLTMDIKYVYIHGERRHAYLLTIMDVFTRKVLDHMLKRSIRKQHVILLLDGIIQEYDVSGVILRNDNGSQFIAHQVRAFLQERGIQQEFTHIATPEENAYIEALHSTLQRDVIRRSWFDSIYHAKMKIADYYKVYNRRRKHRALNRKSPDQYWKNYYENLKSEPILYNQSLLN